MFGGGEKIRRKVGFAIESAFSYSELRSNSKFGKISADGMLSHKWKIGALNCVILYQ